MQGLERPDPPSRKTFGLTAATKAIDALPVSVTDPADLAAPQKASGSRTSAIPSDPPTAEAIKEEIKDKMLLFFCKRVSSLSETCPAIRNSTMKEGVAHGQAMKPNQIEGEAHQLICQYPSPETIIRLRKAIVKPHSYFPMRAILYCIYASLSDTLWNSHLSGKPLKDLSQHSDTFYTFIVLRIFSCYLYHVGGCSVDRQLCEPGLA
ncbi:hypothetical protein BS47DRAFT_1352661 [Hydnum rufescens UP504]|uniref:Uncharacterized protein n=1 Tax=Hydnum rufescens UP504 TaxID=1448309 RepID=A0A9P6AIK0_9AGAM|nr:hypothetical protein BS47DRAFT_1352661 [Hydnum rufescens UP504]